MILASLLCASLLTGSISVHANTVSTDSSQTAYRSELNHSTETATAKNSQPIYSFEEAAKVYRKHLANRDINFELTINKPYYTRIAADLMEEAVKVTRDTKPNEGDYIRANTTRYKYTIRTTETTTTLGYTMNYLADANEEQEVNLAVKRILDDLNVYHADDYSKIKAVYHWITNNVYYDQTYTRHSSYSALVEKKVVCQGYASAIFRLLKELNVGVRYITGLGFGQGHAWNIVKIGDVWYNMDATWDAGTAYAPGTTYYFLKSPRNFNGHQRDSYYDNGAFHSQYPMASKSYNPDDAIGLSVQLITLTKGVSKKLNAKNLSSGETVTDVIWSSDNPNAAVVDANGTVTATGKGTAVITAKTNDGAFFASCTVTTKIAVSSVKLNKSKVTMEAGTKTVLKSTVNPADANNKAVVFKSSNSKIVKVDSKTSQLTALKNGSAIITVTTTDGAKVAKCKVTVKTSVKSVKLSKSSVSLKKGNSITLQAKFTPSTASNLNAVYKSSNTKVATVTAKWRIKGLKKGTAIITVISEDGKKTSKCKVTVC